jgi:hypothetical protein
VGSGKIGHDHRIRRGAVVIIKKTFLWHFPVNVYNRDLPSEVAHGSLASQAPRLPFDVVAVMAGDPRRPSLLAEGNGDRRTRCILLRIRTYGN